MRIRGFILTCMLMLLLTGCASGTSKEDVTAVHIEKTGKVVGTVVETLDQDYYDEMELSTMIKDEIAAYNQNAGSEKVKLESFNADSDTAMAEIHYADAQSYASFNDMTFFLGTVQEAEQAGYQLEGMDLQSAGEGKEDVASLLAENDIHVVIMEEPIKVVTYGAIKAASSNVTIVNKKEATVAIEEEQQLGVILFK